MFALAVAGGEFVRDDGSNKGSDNTSDEGYDDGDDICRNNHASQHENNEYDCDEYKLQKAGAPCDPCTIDSCNDDDRCGNNGLKGKTYAMYGTYGNGN